MEASIASSMITVRAPRCYAAFLLRRTNMADLKFQCFKCNTVSAMRLTAEGRDTVYRMRDDPSVPQDVTFYCEHCGAANIIAITAEALSEVLHKLSSDDPEIQRAI